VFYFIPGDAHGIKEEVLQANTAFTNLRSYVQDHVDELTRQIIRHALNIDTLASEQLLTDEVREHINKLSKQLLRQHSPALSTHYLPNEDSDDIISAFKRNGLDNGPEDMIKVIRLPIYLDGKDGLIDLTMEQAAAGCHLGLFPSYYEPWGYTPMESATVGTPAITTDLAGFGRFVQDTEVDQKGVLVLDRHKKGYDHIVEQLYESMNEFVHLSKEERSQRRQEALKVSSLTQWSTFIKHYIQAHNEAYEIANNR
jgi:glycosyltransferase involved in cell wall biosynthesis